MVLCYPPHCTHALQGLDAVCFAKMKAEWHAALDAFYETRKRGVNKEDFAEIFGTAYNKSFCPNTVSAAFRVTGIHPYDPSVISEQRMKPSEVTSTRTTFPLPLPSPCRRIMAAYRHSTPGAHNGDEAISGIEPAVTLDHNHPSPSSLKRTLDNSIDPALFTPTKRMRASLAMSVTGSFLSSNLPIDPSTPLHLPVLESAPSSLPQPNFNLVDSAEDLDQLSRDELEDHIKSLTHNLSLAKRHIQVHKGINEAANAQLVMQHMHAEKLQVALLEKPKKRTDDRRSIIFGDGKGRVVTSLEVVSELEKLEEELKKKEVEKLQRQSAREAKKDAKEKLDREWAAIKALHETAVESWNVECNHLAEQRVPKSRWPKKPKRPTKPRAPPIVHDHAGSSSEGDDDGDNSE